MRGDLNRFLPIIRTRSVRHIAVFTSNEWGTLCNENRGAATPWVLGPGRTLGLHWPSHRLHPTVREVPLCEDCSAKVELLAKAVYTERGKPVGPTLLEAWTEAALNHE